MQLKCNLSQSVNKLIAYAISSLRILLPLAVKLVFEQGDNIALGTSHVIWHLQERDFCVMYCSVFHTTSYNELAFDIWQRGVRKEYRK